VPSELIGVVASAKEFQGDYERRLRDLRMLGWDYKVLRKGSQGARTKGLLQAGPVSALAREHTRGPQR